MAEVAKKWKVNQTPFCKREIKYFNFPLETLAINMWKVVNGSYPSIMSEIFKLCEEYGKIL